MKKKSVMVIFSCSLISKLEKILFITFACNDVKIIQNITLALQMYNRCTHISEDKRYENDPKHPIFRSILDFHSSPI